MRLMATFRAILFRSQVAAPEFEGPPVAGKPQKKPCFPWPGTTALVISSLS
jgi:hypothetical protein